MKIGLVSDLHLGYNEDSYGQAEEALNRALELSDFLIIPGDLFDLRVQKYEVIDRAVKVFKDIQDKSACQFKVIENTGNDGAVTSVMRKGSIIAIPGTHERRTKGLINAVQLFDTAGLMINANNRAVVFEKTSARGVEKVAVQGIAGMPEDVFKAVLKQVEFKPVPDAFNILIFHQALKEVMDFGEFASIRDLPSGFDFYLNGHIHLRHDFGEVDGKRVLIPGSTVVTQMKRNEVEPKGFYIFDTGTKSAEFFPISSRPFFYLEFNFKDGTKDEVIAKVQAGIAEVRSDNANAMLKLKLKGSLASGVLSKDLDFSQIFEKFDKERRLISIDKEFVSDELKDKIDLLRSLRVEKVSVKDIGLGLLKQKLEKADFKLNADDLFDLLSEGEVEKAAESLKTDSFQVGLVKP